MDSWWEFGDVPDTPEPEPQWKEEQVAQALRSSNPQDWRGLAGAEAIEADPNIDPTNLMAGFGSNLVNRGVGAAFMSLPGMMASEVPVGMAMDKVSETYDNPALNFLVGLGAPLAGGRFLEDPIEQGIMRMGSSRGVVQPDLLTLGGASKLSELWGGETPKEMQFRPIENLPGLRQRKEFGGGKGGGAIKSRIKGAQGIAETFGDNPIARELSALYNEGKIDIDQFGELLNQNLMRDEAGRTVFDRIFDFEAKSRIADAYNAGRTKYAKNQKFNINKKPDLGSNAKLAGSDIVVGDTSKGCMGMCPECFAKYGMSGANKAFCDPVPVEMTGNFWERPDAFYRIGENGEPNMDPRKWEEIRKDYILGWMLGKPATKEELDEIMEKTYDWSWTNEQLKKTNLDSDGYYDMDTKRYVPGGKDQTFVITKLQSLKGFDPNVIRNLQVSIDPAMPDHAIRALKNATELMEKYPGKVNIQFRIRSFATGSDEMNTIMKAAVDTANKFNIPVLETRVRFKNPTTMELAQVLPGDYFFSGGQYKPISYWASPAGVLEQGKKLGGGVTARGMHYRTPEGIEEAPYVVANRGKKTGRVYGPEGEITSGPMPQDEAAFKAIEASMEHGPSLESVRIMSRGESPLSRFGLRPELNHQCNTFNLGNACQYCKECDLFARTSAAKARAMGAKEALIGDQ